MKLLALPVAAVLVASPAVAGPYVNVENNSGFTNEEYAGSLLEAHVGYDAPIGSAGSFYIQGGPAISLPDEGDSDTELSGKVGVGFDVADGLNIYGELWAMTAADSDYLGNAKVGVRYDF